MKYWPQWTRRVAIDESGRNHLCDPWSKHCYNAEATQPKSFLLNDDVLLAARIDSSEPE